MEFNRSSVRLSIAAVKHASDKFNSISVRKKCSNNIISKFTHLHVSISRALDYLIHQETELFFAAIIRSRRRQSNRFHREAAGEAKGGRGFRFLLCRRKKKTHLKEGEKRHPSGGRRCSHSLNVGKKKRKRGTKSFGGRFVREPRLHPLSISRFFEAESGFLRADRDRESTAPLPRFRSPKGLWVLAAIYPAQIDSRNSNLFFPRREDSIQALRIRLDDKLFVSG